MEEKRDGPGELLRQGVRFYHVRRIEVNRPRRNMANRRDSVRGCCDKKHSKQDSVRAKWCRMKSVNKRRYNLKEMGKEL